MALRVQGAVQMTSQLSDADFLHQLEAAYANLHPKSTATALSTASRSFPQSLCIVQFWLIITSAQLRVAFEPRLYILCLNPISSFLSAFGVFHRVRPCPVPPTAIRITSFAQPYICIPD